jgi:Cu+-exporting ATPase
VIGGTINLSKELIITTTKEYDQTVLAHIINTVEESSLAKPKIQKIADRISNYFIPLVMFISIIAVII